MNRILRPLRWLLAGIAVAIVIVSIVHTVLRPTPHTADVEHYAVLSAYIEPHLTGDSHDLGSRKELLVIAATTTFSQQMANSNKIKQYSNLVLSTRHANENIGLSRSLFFEFLIANLTDTTLERKFRLPASTNSPPKVR